MADCNRDAECQFPSRTLTPTPLPIPDDCGGGGGEGHKYTFRTTATGWQVLEDNRVIYTYNDKNDNTTYSWQATTEGWLVKDNEGNVIFTYTDKSGENTTYNFEQTDDCGIKITDNTGKVVFEYKNTCAGTTYSFEQDGVDFKVKNDKTGQVVFTYIGTVDTNTTYSYENYKKGFKVTDSDGVVVYIYDPEFDRSDGSYPIDTLLTTVFKGHTTVSTGQILGFTPAKCVVGETLVYDGVGSVGVISKDNGDGTYEVTTMTISPGSRQGVRLGSVNTEDDLPATCTAAETLGWQTPQLGDFAYVIQNTAGEDVISEYVITNIDDSCNITWTFSHSFNAGQYQEQSTTGMSGMILTGGVIPGSFGTPIDPTTLIRGVMRNGVLLTPDAQGKVNVIVDDSHIIVNALPTTGIVDKAEYVVIDANQKVTGTWVHDATGWYQTYTPPVNVKAHQVVTALPTTNIEENVEYVLVDNANKVLGTWVYDPTKGWLQTEVLDKPAHIVVKTLPTTNIDDEAEYVQVDDLTDPVNTYKATWVHTDSGWIKVSETLTATQAHIAVTALPTTNINESAEYLVMTNVNDPTTLTGTYVRVNGNWVQTEKVEGGFHIVTSLPTSNIDDKHAYIVVEDLTKPDETLIGHYAYDKAHNKWISLSSKYEVFRGLTMNGYAVNEEDYQEIPVGAVAPFLGKTAPAHYLLCDGTVYNIGTHPELEAFFVEQFGKVNQFGGNGTSTWAVPDFRGEFLRGAGTNSRSGQGSGAGVGEHQNATKFLPVTADQNHNLPIQWGSYENADTNQTRTGGFIYKTDNNNYTLSGYISTRPTNTSVNWVIKADSTYSIVAQENKYAVSTTLTYNTKAETMIYPVLTAPQGMASMTNGSYLIAPVDGYYSVNFMFPESGGRTVSYFGTYVYLNDVIIGGTREQCGNGGRTSTLWNDTYSMNSGFTLKLKKGDKVRVGIWVVFQNPSKQVVDTGRATMALIQGGGADSNSRAESMLKPNTWAVGVEQDFGDGVYGLRYTGDITIDTEGVRALSTLNTTLNNKNIRVINEGGWVNRGNNGMQGILGQLTGPSFNDIFTNSNGIIVQLLVDASSVKLGAIDTIVGTHPYDIWFLYTKV